MLEMNFLRTPAVGKFIQRDFDHFSVRVGEPFHALFIDLNLSRNGDHDAMIIPRSRGPKHLKIAGTSEPGVRIELE